MRIGVFGGTFDPIHLGHLVLAEQCREQANLDRVLFVPAASPPHKQQQTLTPFAQRVEMLALAISGNPAFQIDELEKDRTGPSFTVDTLSLLAERHPGDTLAFMVGSDSLRDLPAWYQPKRILELAELLVMERTDWPCACPDALRAALNLSADFPLRYKIIDAPLIAIASRDIRKRINQGHSTRYMMPRAVEAYIVDKRLYV